MNDYPIPTPSSWRQGTTEHTEERTERDAHDALTRIAESKMLREPLDLARDWEAETRPNWSEMGFVVVVGVILIGIVVSLLLQNTPLGRWIA